VSISNPEARPALHHVTLVTSEGCLSCLEADEDLTALARAGRLRLTTLPADSPDGAALVARYRPVVFPLVLLDGSVFSTGHLPRRRLERSLTAAARR